MKTWDGGGVIDTYDLLNTQPPHWRVSSSNDADEVVDAGDHAAYGLEGAGVTGEVTVHERTENI